MNKSNYSVEILANGHPLQEFFDNGKHYIEARKGTEFSLRIKNNGFKRILAVPSVDGLSVLDGKEAGEKSSGYIINGYDSLTIDGWRVSDSEVRKFFFSNPEESYAKRKSKGDNLGVIGVAIYREKENHTCPAPIIIKEPYPIFPEYPKYPYRWNDPMCLNGTSQLSANSDNLTAKSSEQHQIMSLREVSQEVGTGWGNSKESYVTTVSFEQEDRADTIFEIYYNTREQLEKMGIDFKKKPLYISPQAFPGNYCQPPEN